MTVAAHTTRSVPASAWRAAVALLALLLYAAAALAQFPLPPDDPEGRVIADVIPQLPPTHASQAQKVMSLVSAKPGSKYSKAKVDEDVRKLYQTRDFRDVRARPVLAADGKVILFFEFDAYQGVIQEIVYKGAHHLKQDELDALTGLRRGNSMNPAANKLACQHIKQRYQEKGRLLTDVYLEEGTKISDTRVVFNVTEGPVARISSIHFTGQHFVTGPRLETQIKSSRQFLRLLGGQYNDAVVENDVI
jgi:outer membrane protein assembly factor BamA